MQTMLSVLGGAGKQSGGSGSEGGSKSTGREGDGEVG